MAFFAHYGVKANSRILINEPVNSGAQIGFALY
jgi:hypothetical protein